MLLLLLRGRLLPDPFGDRCGRGRGGLRGSLPQGRGHELGDRRGRDRCQLLGRGNQLACQLRIK